MEYLVTGGTGFIGSHVVEKLLKEGNKVIIIDDSSLGKKENIAHIQENENLITYQRSICDDLDDIFKNNKINAVFHLAALPRVQFSIQAPEETHEANVNGTFNLLNTCRKFNVKRFVFSSSSSIYGDQEKLPIKEDALPAPISPYALHKLIGEQYCKVFTMLYGMETISLRYFNVYGPRQSPEGGYACLIPKFIKLIDEGTAPTINGDGTNTRDFTFCTDVANANFLAATTTNKECFGQAFNIGAGKNISVNKVTQYIIKLANKNITTIHGPSVIEPKNTLADIQKAKTMLGWTPKIAFEQGLKQTYEYFKKE